MIKHSVSYICVAIVAKDARNSRSLEVRGVVQGKLARRDTAVRMDGVVDLYETSALLCNGLIRAASSMRRGNVRRRRLEQCSDRPCDVRRLSLALEHECGSAGYERGSHGGSRQHAISAELERKRGQDVASRGSNSWLEVHLVTGTVRRKVRDKAAMRVGKVNVAAGLGKGKLDGCFGDELLYELYLHGT